LLACGVDSGARATKAVVLDEEGRCIGRGLLETSSPPEKSARAALEQAVAQAGRTSAEAGALTATGYGRGAVKADRRVTEITCHVRGASRQAGGIRTVIDAGGQDSKVIAVGPRGEVDDFVMNDRCAAGTGRFLEVISRVLGVEVQELGDLALSSQRPAEVASVCVVFAESEVVSLVAKGVPAADIAAGVVKAMAARLRAMTGRVLTLEPAVFVGGVARNRALVESVREQTGLDLAVPEHPQFTGALGAALFSLEKMGRGDYTRVT